TPCASPPTWSGCSSARVPPTTSTCTPRTCARGSSGTRGVRIVVRRDAFVKGSPENPWGEGVGEFSARIREHARPVHDLFVPRFSTTGPAERVVAEVVLLDAVKSYFRYELATACGIPAVTLEGTAEDWQQLAERAWEFARFDLGWWLTPLQPI